jgi:hypothetical protein
MAGLGIDAHGLKIQGRGYLLFFAKIPRGGGQGFQEKLPGGGGSPYFGFYCIFINKSFEILYLPSPPPVCIHGAGVDFFFTWLSLPQLA